ncbi:ChaN family lipoprotein [Faucicola boevrei]|uniref:ChaN family lipoprotein n=1 Tax=Faucicola boevrei TaxID=346665 RepID=UPI000382D19A|nr:ChaN family lipoprotein [Moraxella boevrei]
MSLSRCLQPFVFAVFFGFSPTLFATNIANDYQQTPIISNQIINLQTQQTISFHDFVKQLAEYDNVILGEYHDRVNQHILAIQLLDNLQKIRPQGSLLLEMLTVEQQDFVNQTQQNPPKNLNKLATLLNWQKSWDWQLYGDIVKHPFLYNYPLIATNLTKTEVKILMQGAEPVKGYQSTKPLIKQHIFNTIIKNHDMKADELDESDQRLVNNMVEIQQFRDRRMAEKMLSAPKPTLLLAGNYHAQKNIGVPIHLQDLTQDLADNDPKKSSKTAVVMMLSNTAELGEIDTAKADFAWIIAEKNKK